MTINRHIRARLQDYVKHDDPGYGILITAPWGAGKTHLIKALIRDWDPAPVFISLFGVKNSEDIERAILMARLPMLDNEYVKLGGRLGVAALKLLPGGFGDLKGGDLAKIRLPKVMIFDDFERTNMPIQELTGYLNGFIEQEGKHLILLANEGELPQKVNEKLIGHTLTLRAEVAPALGAFLAKVDDEKARAFLEESRPQIIKVFEQSKTDNLRVLKQSLWDFARVFADISQDLRGQHLGMATLLYQFLALSIEFKSGGLSRKNFKQRDAIIFDREKPKFKDLLAVAQKYDGDFISSGRYDTALPTALAISLICDGWEAPDTLNTKLGQTQAFHLPKEEAEWQTIYWLRYRDEARVKTAFEAMETAFTAREYHDPGIALHVFANRLRLAKAGLFGLEMQTVKQQCRAYVDDMAQGGYLSDAAEVQELLREKPDMRSYLGLGYPYGEHPHAVEFQGLLVYMATAYETAHRQSFGEKCAGLLALLDSDVDLFCTHLTENGKNGLYRAVPVLQGMDVDLFVDKVLSLDVAAAHGVFEALKERYNYPRSFLAPEEEWRHALRAAFKARLPRLSPFRKWQVEAEVKQYLPSPDGEDNG